MTEWEAVEVADWLRRVTGHAVAVVDSSNGPVVVVTPPAPPVVLCLTVTEARSYAERLVEER